MRKNFQILELYNIVEKQKKQRAITGGQGQVSPDWERLFMGEDISPLVDSGFTISHHHCIEERCSSSASSAKFK